jgi:transposase
VRCGSAFETGPSTTWLWSELSKRRLPMVCLDARQAQRALDKLANKTDANDADGAGLPSGSTLTFLSPV